jgi:hypothetical protein
LVLTKPFAQALIDKSAGAKYVFVMPTIFSGGLKKLSKADIVAMNFEDASLYIKEHLSEINDHIDEGNSLCMTIRVLLELYLADPANTEIIGVLTEAVKEYKRTFHEGEDEDFSCGSLLH